GCAVVEGGARSSAGCRPGHDPPVGDRHQPPRGSQRRPGVRQGTRAGPGRGARCRRPAPGCGATGGADPGGRRGDRAGAHRPAAQREHEAADHRADPGAAQACAGGVAGGDSPTDRPIQQQQPRSVEKNGPVWRIRDVVNGRKVTLQTGFPTKTAAKAAMTALRADQLRGEYIDPRAGRITLAAWIDSWWPSYAATLKPSALRSEGSRVRIHIIPALGHYALDDLDPLVIQRWVSDLSAGQRHPDGSWLRKPLSPKTVRNVHGVLHKILEAAV